MWPLRHIVTRFLNPITRLFAGRLPGFGILTYRGRTTGRIYHTPINVFRHGRHYVFVLTYGSGAQWVKNVLAAGECRLRVRGRDVKLVSPEIVVDPELRLAPAPVRFIGKFDRVTEILRMRAA
jgi:deazaflavin-dependent oxidoreductase (nitroreductase family)